MNNEETIDIDIEIIPEPEEQSTTKNVEAPLPTEEVVTPAGFDFNSFLPTDDNSKIFEEVERQEKECEPFVLDPDKLLDPNYLPFVKHVLNLRKRTMNTLTYDEFKHFAPLFDSHNTLSPTEKNDLFQEWQFRVSLYEPVEVYKQGKLIYRIPPMFARTETIDAGVGRKAAETIMSCYGNTCLNKDTMTQTAKGTEYAEMVKDAFVMAQKKNANQRNREEMAAAVDSLVLTGEVKVAPQEAKEECNVSNNESSASDVNQPIEGIPDESDIEYV